MKFNDFRQSQNFLVSTNYACPTIYKLSNVKHGFCLSSLFKNEAKFASHATQLDKKPLDFQKPVICRNPKSTNSAIFYKLFKIYKFKQVGRPRSSQRKISCILQRKRDRPRHSRMRGFILAPELHLWSPKSTNL